MSHAFATNIRHLSLFGAVLLAFVVLAVRLLFLQVLSRDELLVYVDQVRDSVRILHAQRGDILDSQGNLQATSQPVYEVGVDPQDLKPMDWDALKQVADLLDVPGSELVSAFSNTETPSGNKRRWVRLAEAVDRDTFLQIQRITSRAVYGNLVHRRHYPGDKAGAHFIGMLNKEGIPLAGVEQSFDFFLRGQDGWLETETDSRRRELAQFRRREVAPQDGLHIELTLNQVIQDMTEHSVASIVEEMGPDSVSILVSEVDTGSLLAAAIYPNFDPNEYWEYPVDSHRNRAIADVFEPGSTFKVVTAAAALQEGIVIPSDVLKTGDRIVEYMGRRIRMPDEYTGKVFPQLTVRKTVVKSSNRGSAVLGMMLGEMPMYQYARSFGYGHRTGIAVYGEASGILDHPDRWDGITISRLPMGHAIAATPLQVHTAMGAVANGGVLMRPRIVSRIIDRDGRTVSRVAPEEVGRAISESTALVVSDMLAEVVSPEGTARSAQIKGYRAGGKTGTTEKIDPNTKLYLKNANVASFSGFLPVERPEIVITIVVDNPKKAASQTGGFVTGPTFKLLGTQITQYLGIEPVEQPVFPLALVETGGVQ